MDGTVLATNALLNIILSLICISICWWVLMGVRLEVLIRPKRVAQGRLFALILAIVFGHSLATFFIDYMSWTRWLSGFFS